MNNECKTGPVWGWLIVGGGGQKGEGEQE
jgi:hypothetical protein